MQWALSMKAAISKKAVNLIPNYLTKYLSASGNAVSDTSFIWDLVDNYGFQFGKKQDIEKIKSHVPASGLASFEAGLA
jgi:catalase (peroxidase I)